MMMIFRVRSHVVGSLMSGMLGKQPLLDLTKGVGYFLKHVITLLSTYEELTYSTETLAAQNCSAVIAVTESYFKFLDDVGEANACPKKYKPAVTAPDEEKAEGLKLDFSKLDPVAAESNIEAQDKSVELIHLGHGIVKHSEDVITVDVLHEKAEPVKLSVAVALGQKVKGTAVNSVYRVAALGTMYKLACRLQDTTFSVRVEPSENVTIAKGSAYHNKLNDAGLDVVMDATSKKVLYASLHFEGMDYKSSKRVLGAIVADLECFKPSQILLNSGIYQT
ncbi:hypothetical protein ACRXCV_00375 (plasmid) [Halobacteriovorax sp. GFR7]|uniref:hypothetical protein n=1 Tax=unclassified Halobacteriovorax TaxID=2639665 RepID=UPI003D99267C